MNYLPLVLTGVGVILTTFAVVRVITCCRMVLNQEDAIELRNPVKTKDTL
jgi:hypothetical protein